MRGKTFLKLEKDKQEPYFTYLEKVRRAGATDKDIVWYWNMPDSQHKQMKQENDSYILAAFEAKQAEGLSASEAADFIKYTFPRFTSFDNATKEQMEDFLPDELLRYKTNLFRLKKWMKYRKAHPEVETMNDCLRYILGIK